MYSMTEAERAQLVGATGITPTPDLDLLDSACASTNGSSHSKSRTVARMQSYICSLHDNAYHVLGNMGISFGWDLYQLPDLATLLINTAFSGLQVRSRTYTILWKQNI